MKPVFHHKDQEMILAAGDRIAPIETGCETVFTVRTPEQMGSEMLRLSRERGLNVNLLIRAAIGDYIAESTDKASVFRLPPEINDKVTAAANDKGVAANEMVLTMIKACLILYGVK